MAWVAVDQYGNEGIYANKPILRVGFWWDEVVTEDDSYDTEIILPKGTIKKLIGRDLTWEDNPIELKEE